MKKPLMLLAALALSATPALAQSSLKSKLKSAAETTGVAAALGTAPTTADFVKTVAISDMFEIESSKLAQQKADASGKSFADQMIADHSKTSSELKSLVQSGKVKAELPTALDSSHQSKLDKLKQANRGDFTKNYDSEQRSAHKEAVSLFERYAKNGDDAELKQWAAKTLPHLKQHLSMAEKLK